MPSSRDTVDIIGIVKELQARCVRPGGTMVTFHEDRMDLIHAFPAIATHLLAQEEKLRWAMAALERIEAASQSDDCGFSYIVEEVLSRLRSQDDRESLPPFSPL